MLLKFTHEESKDLIHRFLTEHPSHTTALLLVTLVLLCICKKIAHVTGFFSRSFQGLIPFLCSTLCSMFYALLEFLNPLYLDLTDVEVRPHIASSSYAGRQLSGWDPNNENVVGYNNKKVWRRCV